MTIQIKMCVQYLLFWWMANFGNWVQRDHFSYIVRQACKQINPPMDASTVPRTNCGPLNNE